MPVKSVRILSRLEELNEHKQGQFASVCAVNNKMGSKNSKSVPAASRRSSVKSASQDSNVSETELSDPREEDVTGISFLQQKLNFKSPISCADMSDDSSMLVVGREDGILEIFSTFSRESISLAVLRGHKVSNS